VATSLAPDSYVRLFNGEQAQMIFSDPPWNVPIAGNVSGIGKVKRDNFAVACGEMSSTEFENFLQTAHGHASAHSTDGSIHIVCMGWSKMRELY